jgi:hypothetical protein
MLIGPSLAPGRSTSMSWWRLFVSSSVIDFGTAEIPEKQ